MNKREVKLVNRSVKFSKAQIAGLKREAARRKQTFAELVRKALDELIAMAIPC